MLDAISWDDEMTIIYHHLFINYQIRDTNVHESPAIEWKGEGPVTIYMINTHDQSITITIKGNIQKTSLNAVTVGDVITVGANTTKSYTLTPDTTGYFPNIIALAQASTAPTSGDLTVTAVEVRKE